MSSTHILLECQEQLALNPRTQLLKNHKGAVTWDSMTTKDLQQTELIRFMATTGILKVRNISITDDDAREEGYELGEAI